VPSIALICVLAAWLIMGLATVLRPRSPKAREVRRGSGWSLGFILQVLSMGLVFAWHRTLTGSTFWPISVFAIVLAAASVVLIVAAQRALGRQFAYQARLVESHQLITAGPYGLVRHPIYTGLLGLTLATSLVVSAWPAVPLFLAVYLAGTVMRIRSEERLLRDGLGAQFEEYARRVPALIPRLRAARRTSIDESA
jgi:protein-S-isoprenylcysteine O-methyltransferase Ste14